MTASRAATCAHENCFAPDTACVLGNDHCPHLVSDASAQQGSQSAGSRLPWSGLALGSTDLLTVAALGRSSLVGIVGVANAGKTTALAATMMGLRRGVGRFADQFAGSYTLIGWNRIAFHLHWVPHGSGFPPHTTTADRRIPSLLHMALHSHSGAINHLLYTDVPGEWFKNWAYDVDAGSGTTWIAQHANAFVLLADSDALSGPERGRARADYDSLAHRLASVRGDRPVVPVLSKSDLIVPEAILRHVQDMNRSLFGAETMRVSVKHGAGDPLTDVIDAGTEAALMPRRVASSNADAKSGDALFAYRSQRYHGATR